LNPQWLRTHQRALALDAFLAFDEVVDCFLDFNAFLVVDCFSAFDAFLAVDASLAVGAFDAFLTFVSALDAFWVFDALLNFDCFLKLATGSSLVSSRLSKTVTFCFLNALAKCTNLFRYLVRRNLENWNVQFVLLPFER
jgi:hypothetical protein